VQVLMAERLDDRRTILELRRAGGPQRQLPGDCDGPATATRDYGAGTQGAGDSERLHMQCKALQIKCVELERLNSDMSTFVQTLSTALEIKMREIDELKQDRSLSYAIGRLPGHLPGCRSCAARDALIDDLREEVAGRSKGKKELMPMQKVLEETEAKNMQLTRDIDQWREKADLRGKQLSDLESSSSAAKELHSRLQHELDNALASCKKLSETEDRLAAEQTRVKELQGKVRSLQNDFTACQVLQQAKNAEISELEQIIAKRGKDECVVDQLKTVSNELDKERHAHLELKQLFCNADEEMRRKDAELLQARERGSTLEKHAEALAADVERLFACLQVPSLNI
jgi:hypothetical protein